MTQTSKIHHLKTHLVVIVITFFFLVTTFLLTKWQILNSDKFATLADSRIKEQTTSALRGTILAADDTSLAYSEPRFDFYVWLVDIEEAESRGRQTREEMVSKVAELLKVKEKDISSMLDSGPSWIKIASNISPEIKTELEGLKTDKDNNRPLAGMRFEYVNIRSYPEDNLASQVIGFVAHNENGDEIGVGGIEQYWDGNLQPLNGTRLGEVDSFGNPINVLEEQGREAKDGLTIKTTIDKTLQAILEKNLKDGVLDFKAKSATGIIMDPKTGAIKALANFPDFNPNKFLEVKDSDLFGNTAITSPYEIGSIAKVFTVAAAVDDGKLSPGSIILPNGHKGCQVITPGVSPNAACGGRVECVCTYDKGGYSGAMDVQTALVRSDNVAFVNIGSKLDYKTYYQYLNKFGVGSLTGIDLSGESTGLLKDYQNWGYSDFAVYTYGHGFEITPLQAIVAVGAIANEGRRMQPYIVESISDGESETVTEPHVVKKVVDKETAKEVALMMNKVYEQNVFGYPYQDLSKYNISLKSGTALIPYSDRLGYSSDINTTFIGFDNSSKGSFIMLIKLERPRVGTLSFHNARVVWMETFKDIKDYLGVPEKIN